ncbi:hypothetical protein ACFO4O_06325 [Glaciecola siphonariae]|uniref:Uncharacterized protein n=1 Tax=Glaciecola siphonariae TaxID=521012 RepID=A0ABV9LUC6_9ALTE
MESVSTIKQSLYVNDELNATRKPRSPSQNNDASGSQTPASKISEQVIKTGSNQTMADAEAIFARANSYSDVSAKVQKNLQAYESVELSLKREALSELMGVDLYA